MSICYMPDTGLCPLCTLTYSAPQNCYCILQIRKRTQRSKATCPKHLVSDRANFELSPTPDPCYQLLHCAAQGDAKGKLIYSKNIFKKSNKPRERWRCKNQTKKLAEIYTLYILLNIGFY